MTTITLTMEDKKAEQLRDRARHYGVDVKELLAASIEDLVGRPEADFRGAMQKVLAKNLTARSEMFLLRRV